MLNAMVLVDSLHILETVFGYFFVFLALYVQVFLMILIFKERKQIIKGTIFPKNVNWPAITITIPCWNEEDTIVKTVNSLLEIDYPKDKLIVNVIDDGSTDRTWERVQVFHGVENVCLMRKENGGKYTALNLALATATTEYVGNLDADAFIEKDVLKKTMWQFLSDPEMMAVSPSVVIHEPKGFLEKAQEVEFNLFILMKIALSSLNGIHVCCGQFSIFRKKVFDDLGPYRKGHQNEDLEISYRMQINGYKIGQCHDALVHTMAMDTLPTLYKQRLRWAYGFINNNYDYRKYLFSPKYGTFSIFSVPVGIVYMLSILFSASVLIWALAKTAYSTGVWLMATNFHIGNVASSISSSFFFVDTRPLILVSVILLIIMVTAASIAKKIRGQRPIPSISFVYFFILFSFVGVSWLVKALYKTLISRTEVAWR